MTKIPFNKLGLKLIDERESFKYNDLEIEVRKYLPLQDKINMIQFIISHTLDENTGCFSPTRIEPYYSIAICKWYTNITFTEKQIENIAKTYDLLEENGFIAEILDHIPKEEKEFMESLVNNTIKDISRYNSSAAGIINTMSSSSGDLNQQIDAILKDISEAKGLDLLATIKENAVGSD